MDRNLKLVQEDSTQQLAEPMPKVAYLQKRGNRYWFRFAVPHALRSIIGKPEILKALDTSDLAVAKQRLAFETAKTHAIIRDAQRRAEAGIPKFGLGDDPQSQNVIRYLLRHSTTGPSPQTRIAETLRSLTEEFGADSVRNEIETWFNGQARLTATGKLVTIAAPMKKRAPTFGEVLTGFRKHQRQSKSPKTIAKEHAQDALFLQLIDSKTPIDEIGRADCRRERR